MEINKQFNTTYSVGVRTNLIRPEAGQEYHELFYEFDKALSPELIRMRLTMFCLLDKCREQTYRVRLSLNQMYDECGFHMDRNYKYRKIYQNIIAAIDLLVEDGFMFPLQKRIEDCRVDEQMTFYLDSEVWQPLSLKTGTGGTQYLEPYVIFDSGKFNKLAAHSGVKLQDALYVYLYMLSFMASRRKLVDVKSQPRYYFAGVEKLARGVGMSVKTVRKILTVLCDLQILHRGAADLRSDHFAKPYFYVDSVEGWEEELEAAKDKINRGISARNKRKIIAGDANFN